MAFYLPNWNCICNLADFKTVITWMRSLTSWDCSRSRQDQKKITTTEYILKAQLDTKTKLCFDYVRTCACSLLWIQNNTSSIAMKQPGSEGRLAYSLQVLRPSAFHVQLYKCADDLIICSDVTSILPSTSFYYFPRLLKWWLTLIFLN